MMKFSVSNSLSVWVCGVVWALMLHISLTHTHLCGPRLADTMEFICNQRGFDVAKRSGGLTAEDNTLIDQNDLEDRGATSGNGGRTRFRGRNLLQRNANINTKDGESGGNIPDNKSLAANKRRFDPADFPTYAESKHPFLSRNSKRFASTMLMNSGKRTTTPHHGDTIIAGTDRRSNRNRRQVQGENIVTECCHRTCSLMTLMSYCGTNVQISNSVEALRYMFSVTTPHPTSTEDPRRLSTQPPALINLVNNRDTSSWFYLPIAPTATRRPLFTNSRRYA